MAVVLVVGLAFALLRAQAEGGFGPLAGIGLAVGWAGLWTLAAFGAGDPVVRWLRGEWNGDIEGAVLSAIAGAAVLTACAAALSLAGWFRPLPMMMVAALWAVWGAVVGVRRRPAGAIRSRAILPLIGLAAVALLVAATVSPFYDQWHQHLGFPWLWLQRGSIHVLPRNWYSFMPVNSSLLFAYGLGTLGPWSAQIVHLWSGLVTVIAAALLARRIGPPRAAIWTAWILATSPTLLHLATTAGSDLVITLYGVGAWLGLSRTCERRTNGLRWWAFAGACVGLAAGTKVAAIGTVAIPAAAGAVVLHRPWRRDASTRTFFSGAALATGSALLVFAPWAVRNFVATGNPMFPFANRMFRGSLEVPFEAADRFAGWLSGFDLSPRHLIEGLDLGALSWSVDGFPSVGLAFLGLAPVALLVWRRLRQPMAGALAAAALLGIAFWMASKHANRYLLPALVPAAALLGTSVDAALAATSGRVRTALSALLGIVLAWNLGVSVSEVGLDRLGCTLGVKRQQALLEQWVSSSPAFQEVAALPTDATILLVAESRGLGFDRAVVLEHPFGEPLLEELARRSESPREMAFELGTEGVTHLLANRWEARRIAAMNRRARYFSPADPATLQRLDRFARECLSPVWSGRGLGLYRVVPDCGATAPGAGDLASW